MKIRWLNFPSLFVILPLSSWNKQETLWQNNLIYHIYNHIYIIKSAQWKEQEQRYYNWARWNSVIIPYFKFHFTLSFIYLFLKQLTKFIEKRLSETSSSKAIFDKSLKLYQDALKKSGFSNDLRYVQNKNNTNNNKRKRKRKIIWFNSPFSKSVDTNIGKMFLHLLSKHFPKDHKMHKILLKKYS